MAATVGQFTDSVTVTGGCADDAKTDCPETRTSLDPHGHNWRLHWLHRRAVRRLTHAGPAPELRTEGMRRLVNRGGVGVQTEVIAAHITTLATPPNLNTKAGDISDDLRRG
jgi:hypothetical protein